MRRSSITRFPSPLRYPGGKGKIANYFKLLMLENDLLGVEYVEPYAGGAGVALALLYDDFASHVHINDINSGVHAFWHAAMNDTEALCRRIESAEVTVEQWRRQRSVQRDPGATILELAFSTFFLNRVNRSGIVSGGLIGGSDQQGAWKLDARYNKTSLIRRIEKIGRFRSRITLTRLDAAEMLLPWMTAGSPTSIIYLDPPYYVKGVRLYDNFYGHDDHVEVARSVNRLQHPWVVSYDAAPEIFDIYGGGTSIRYSLSYSAAKRYQGPEMMFFSPGLMVPREVPAGITLRQVDERRLLTLPV